MGTDYSLVISDVNHTITNSIVTGFGVRVTGLSIQDSVDGSTSSWGNGHAVSDAVQATSIFFFRTSTNHLLRFTVTFQLYNLLPLGSIADQTVTNSFNVTQTVLWTLSAKHYVARIVSQCSDHPVSIIYDHI